jgi:hypothetical protein
LWRGDGGDEESKGKYTHWDDSNSEDVVLAADTAAAKGPMEAIVKTVSVTITSIRTMGVGLWRGRIVWGGLRQFEIKRLVLYRCNNITTGVRLYH